MLEEKMHVGEYVIYERPPALIVERGGNSRFIFVPHKGNYETFKAMIRNIEDVFGMKNPFSDISEEGYARLDKIFGWGKKCGEMRDDDGNEIYIIVGFPKITPKHLQNLTWGAWLVSTLGALASAGYLFNDLVFIPYVFTISISSMLIAERAGRRFYSRGRLKKALQKFQKGKVNPEKISDLLDSEARAYGGEWRVFIHSTWPAPEKLDEIVERILP